MEQIISDFNEILLSLALNISEVCPNTVIGAHIKDVEKFIKRKDNAKKFIELFCLKVLQYKDQIDAGNETFFLKKDYKNDLDDDDILSHVISMKNVWTQLKQENKQIVIMNMQMLCELAQQYYDIVFT